MNELARHSRAASDTRMGSLMFIMGVFLIAVMIVFSTTDAVPMGVDEGEMPPNVEGKAHQFGAGNVWYDFDLYELTVSNWTEGDLNHSWFVVEFISTDCSVCMGHGDVMEELSTGWKGKVQFIAVAVDFKNSEVFTSTPEEIIAFQEKTDFVGCNQGSSNCNSRDGGPHEEIIYVDDRDASSMEDWGISGTPTSFILKPNGIVAWNQRNNAGQELGEAMLELIPYDGPGGA
ncbi:MAG: hypothetical protein CMB49_04845 [Euryarchaeota archaeon]|nr:hypothetical protein [Euryarchaeota archaeon]